MQHTKVEKKSKVMHKFNSLFVYIMIMKLYKFHQEYQPTLSDQFRKLSSDSKTKSTTTLKLS